MTLSCSLVILVWSKERKGHEVLKICWWHCHAKKLNGKIRSCLCCGLFSIKHSGLKKAKTSKKNIFVTRAVKLQKIVKTPFLTECNDISCSRNIIVVFEERKTCFEMHSMLTIKFFLGRFETDLNERPSTFFPVSLSVDWSGTSSPAKTPCVLNNRDYLVQW